MLLNPECVCTGYVMCAMHDSQAVTIQIPTEACTKAA